MIYQLHYHSTRISQQTVRTSRSTGTTLSNNQLESRMTKEGVTRADQPPQRPVHTDAATNQPGYRTRRHQPQRTTIAHTPAAHEDVDLHSAGDVQRRVPGRDFGGHELL